MKTKKRKIIFKAIVGSQLYGTNRPTSDMDYLGVFLPSEEDLLGMQECPREYTENEKISTSGRNTKGDVDCKYFSLKQFLKLAAEGQSIALELLFVPEGKVLIKTPEWASIKEIAPKIILSKQGIRPFIGFALAQAHKATIKGDNLNKINGFLSYECGLGSAVLNAPLAQNFNIKDGKIYLFDYFPEFEINIKVNDHGFKVIEIAGRQWDVNLKTKTFLNNLKELRNKYGTRSQAAAEQGYDFKSLLHAYRLLSEAKEFLLNQKITFPRPDAEFLKTIREGQYEADYFDEITKAIDDLRQNVEPNSKLPEHPNWKKINTFCAVMQYIHLTGDEDVE